MKKIIFLFACFFIAISSAYSASIDPDYKPDTLIFYYDSYDAFNNKVRLSGKAYYYCTNASTLGIGIKHILLACHPTVTSNPEAPSGNEPIDMDLSRMCTEDNNSVLVISPDYCGYGISSHLQHPYLIHDVTARNCFDALLPAIEEVEKRKYVSFNNKPDGKGNDKYELSIVGYSQGGATALACAKYYDSDACPSKIANNFDLIQTCCGDGPYSIYHTIKQYMEWGDPTRNDGGLNLEFPCVIPLIISAAKDAYNDGCMRTVEVEDFFSKEFLKTGIVEAIKSKNIPTDGLGRQISGKISRLRPVDVLSRKIIKENGTFNTETKEYKCFMRAMELADLTQGWEPKHPITFYHLKSDNVVPYVNYSEGIAKGIGKSKYVSYVSADSAYTAGAAIIGLVKPELTVSPEWSKMKHDDGGVYFYVSYLFGSALRRTTY